MRLPETPASAPAWKGEKIPREDVSCLAMRPTLPVVSPRRPTPAPVEGEGQDGKKLLDGETSDVLQRARDYCEQQGWSAGNGELFGKALEAVSPAHRMPD